MARNRKRRIQHQRVRGSVWSHIDSKVAVVRKTQRSPIDVKKTSSELRVPSMWQYYMSSTEPWIDMLAMLCRTRLTAAQNEVGQRH